MKTRSEYFEDGAILSDTLRGSQAFVQSVNMNNILDISLHTPPLNLCPSSNAGSAMLFDSSINNNKGAMGGMGTDSSMATPKNGIPRLSSILGKRGFPQQS